MITLDEILIELTDALGTAEQNLYTEDRRLRAINRAVQKILTWYDLDQYRVSTTLSFNSSVAILPTDMLRPIQLRNSTQNTPYLQVDFEEFQENIPYTWIYKYDTATDDEKIEVYPTYTGSLQFWYMQMPPELVDGTDALRLKSWWLAAIAYEAASFLFTQTSNFNRAEAAQQRADVFKADAWQSERQKITGKEEQRLRSVYERNPFFQNGNYWVSSLSNTQPMLWTTINSDTVATVNYGYFTNSASLVTITLPETANVGDIIQVAGQGVGGWRVAQNNGQQIFFGIVQTTQGTGGYLESTATNDAITLVCRVTNTTWEVITSLGNITYV